jgi:hypothetical protein
VKKKLSKKILVFLSIISILIQSISPFVVLSKNIAYAEEPTPTESPTPTEEITPTVEVTPTPEILPTQEVSPSPDLSPTPTVEETTTTTEASSANQTQDQNQSSSNNSSGNKDNSSSQSTTTTTQAPTPEPVTKTGNEELEVAILNDVSAPSIDLQAVNTYGSATLATDKPDYAPTDTALITGSNLLPGTLYTLIVSSSNSPPVNFSTEVTSDENGIFGYAYQLDGTYRPDYSVELKDQSGAVVATVTFTDSAVIGGSAANSGAITSRDIDFTKTIPSGSNRLLLVGVSIRPSSVSVSSITWRSSCSNSSGSQSLSVVSGATASVSGRDARTEIWQLKAPTVRTNGHICVTLSTNPTKAVAGAVDFADVDQTTPISNSKFATSTSGSSISIIPTSSSGNIIFGVLAFHDNDNPTDGQTNQWNIHGGSPSHFGALGSTKSSDAGSTTLTWTSLGSPDSIAASAVEIKSFVVADITPPTVPGNPTTTSPTTDTTPTWTWTASTDTGSGLATNAYDIQWCSNTSFTGCDSNVSTSTTNSFTHTTALSIGTWYAKVRANDVAGNHSSYSGNGSVVINSPNAAPANINLSSSSIAENQSINTTVGSFTTTDPNSGDTFTYSLVSGTGSTDNASFNISGSNLRTSASFNYEVKNSYTILVRTTDQGGLTFEKQFTISVTNVNEAPTISSITNKITNEDTSTGPISLTIADVDNPVANLTLSGTSSNAGLVSVSGIVFGGAGASRTVNITPLANQSGTTTITITVSDGSLTASTSFTLTVNPVNDPPIAVNDSYSTNQNTTLTIAAPGVLSNDSDTDGDPIHAVMNTVPTEGTLNNGNSVAPDGSFVYTPNSNYVGTDSFTYFADDGNNNGNIVTVTITVVDNVSPTVVSVDPDTATFNLADMPSKVIKVTFSENIANTPIIGVNPPYQTQTVTNCGDDNAKTFCFTYSIVNGQETTYTIYVNSAQDTAGNVMTQDSNHYFYVDTIAPTAVTISYSTTDWTNGDVIATLNPSEPITVTNNDGSTSHTFTINGSFTFEFVDAAGNLGSATATVNNIDKTAPTGSSINYTDGYYATASVPLTVNDGTDIGSGINEGTRMVFRSEAVLANGTCGEFSDFTKLSPFPSGAYPNSVDTTVIDGHCYSYEYLVSDDAHNQTVYTSSNVAKVDTTAPTLSANPPEDDYDSDQLVTLSSTDSGSGLGKIYYTLDGSTPDNTKTEYTGTAITVDKDMTIKAIAYDNAGNASDVLSATYGIPPKISGEAFARVNDTSLVLSWTTDDLSTSRVVYDTVSHPEKGDGSNYGYAYTTDEFDTGINKTTSHSVTITGVDVNKTYYYRVISHGSPEAVGSENPYATYYIYGLAGDGFSDGGSDGKSDGGSSGGGVGGGALANVLGAFTFAPAGVGGVVLGAETQEGLQEEEVLGTESAVQTPTITQAPSSNVGQQTLVDWVTNGNKTITILIVALIIFLCLYLFYFRRRHKKNEDK